MIAPSRLPIMGDDGAETGQLFTASANGDIAVSIAEV
ncbi:Uncharacterised protein [Mycobacteroides abscessus subsp. massiliense]|nr:Uncharacterised protein [Mycobacteroides abscessus subsp. massiliense]